MDKSNIVYTTLPNSCTNSCNKFDDTSQIRRIESDEDIEILLNSINNFQNLLVLTINKWEKQNKIDLESKDILFKNVQMLKNIFKNHSNSSIFSDENMTMLYD